MLGWHNHPIAITPLYRGSPWGSPSSFFSGLFAAKKWQKNTDLKDGSVGASCRFDKVFGP